MTDLTKRIEKFLAEGQALLDEVREAQQPKLKVDDKVMVRQHPNVPWDRRHFSYFSSGQIYCFADGRTSWSSKDLRREKVHTWAEWRLPTEEELK